MAETVARRPVKDFYNPRQKAFFLNTSSVEFVRPGLNISVTSAAIEKDGTITANFTIADPSGLPLDLTGVTTPGVITLNFVAAAIPNGQESTSVTSRAPLAAP